MEKFSLLDIILNKDDKSESGESAKGKQFFSREYGSSINKSFNRYSSSRTVKFFKKIAYFISHVSTRAYGASLISFGLVCTLIYFLGLSCDESIKTPVFGIIVSCLSVLFLLADKPLPIYLQDFALTDYIFFEFFCMRRHTVNEEKVRFPLIISIGIGALLAIASAFAPLWLIIVVIASAIFVYVGMESPEFIFLASIFAIPYLRYIPHSNLYLCIAIAVAMVSFLRKVIQSKRVLYIEQYDIFIGIMMLFVLISGVFVKGFESFSDSLSMIILSFGYMLAGNIITNRRLADRVVNSIILSATLASVTSIAQLVFVIVRAESTVTGSDLSHLLARSDGMSVVLIAAFVFSVGMIKQARPSSRFLYVFAGVFCFCALVISGEVFAIFVAILGLIGYAVMKMNNFSSFVLPVLMFSPMILLLLPNSVLDVLFGLGYSVSSADQLFVLWENSLSAFLSNFFLGIGIGSESFAQEMAAFGIFGYPDSSNLLIEIGLEAGAFALIFFLAILLTRLRHRLIQYIFVRNSEIEVLANLSGACFFSLLAFGMVNYIWSEPSAYYLFWCIFGIGSATLRVAKKDYDDRVLYYEETSAQDSSVIDIEIG